ncbi:MAG TPA: SBBP repeat-containing protein [Candidatus Deferrimicrobium sp.]|nr:SBBP repeat-containing protein [Candidatus Deferrimicrobium sp.]
MKKYFVLTAIIFIIILFSFSIRPVVQAKTLDLKPAGAKLDFNFGDVPLYFISNQGQVNQEAGFYAQTSKYVLWLTKEGLVFDHPGSDKGDRDVYRLIFMAANKNPEMIAAAYNKDNKNNELKVNYFKGNDKSQWHCDIPTSKAVLYKNIYQNIDLKVYGIEKQVEYDWIVKPGGDPTDICFEYQETKKTRIDDQGNLAIESGFNESLHKRPIAFQAAGKEKPVAVAVKFKKIAENRYGFEVGNYDKNRELIIDPAVLTYSTYLGGKQADVALGVAVDNNGYTYVTGMTSSTNFPIKGQYQSNHGAENYDAFVAKLDTTRSGSSSLIYATFLGGTESDNCTDIAVDNSGKVYLTGQTWSADFPAKNAYQTYKGDGDAFLVKIDTTLSGAAGLIYSTYLGGLDTESSQGIAADNKGNAYIVGSTYSLDFPTLNACDSVTAEDTTDGFVARIDTTRSGTASLIYSTYLGGLESEDCLDIAVDDQNCAYITGWTYSKDFPTKNRYQTFRGFADAFVTKINTAVKGAAGLIYSSYLGGSDSDYGQGIAVDANSGYAYVTGITRSTNFPTLKPYQKYQGDSDAFVTAVDTTRTGTASLLYSTYLGGNKFDKGNGITLDPNNNQCVFVTGVTRSANFPTLKPYQTSQGQDNEDAFAAKIDTAGNGTSCLLFATYLGGKNADGGNDIAVDDSGNVFVTGWTYSTNFPTLNQYQKDPGDNNNNDVFLTRFLLEPDKPPAIQLSRPALDFSAVTGTANAHTGSQVFYVNNSGDGSLNWTASTSGAWLTVEPSTGAANAPVSVSVDPAGLPAGVTTGTITISDPDAENSPQTLTVTLTVRAPGSTNPPFGDFSTPIDGAAVSSSIAVTGWVLDDIGVESVKIYRLEGESPIYIGDALFVEGARPDIETAYPGYPMNYRAGWGYMMLTHFLPAGGNGTFILQAIATDAEGQQVTLGTRTIIADNAHAVKPFGAIDTPTQGGTASGNKFTNWGWVLTPQPNKIPVNGSTINVWIDGVSIGHPTYNVSRPDIAGLFSDYANSSGAGGYFNLDTPQYPNGIHIIFWTATDEAGNSDGIGSRYFSIQNPGVGNPFLVSPGPEIEAGDIMTGIAAPVEVKKGFNPDMQPEPVYPDDKGCIYIGLKELERVEIHFPGASTIKPLGLQVVPGRFRPLPVGSILDKEKNIFYWQPGPGFVGHYRLVFALKNRDGNWSKRNIQVHIMPGSHSRE